jgi:hypothetical protein
MMAPDVRNALGSNLLLFQHRFLCLFVGLIVQDNQISVTEELNCQRTADQDFQRGY